MATRLQDIAERAGVSISTVSLVLNGRDRGRVNAASAARIRDLSEEMGYLPNLLARGLKTRSSKTIGVIAEGVASIPFASEMLGGAQEAAWEQGYLLLTVDIGHQRTLKDSAAKVLVQRDIDGLILTTDYPRSMPVPDVPPSIPMVMLGARPVPPEKTRAPHPRSAVSVLPAEPDWIVPDDEGGARRAVAELVSAGHVRIGFCTIEHPDFVSAERQRLAGYLRGLQDSGIERDDALIARAAGPETADGRAVAPRLLDLRSPPTAVFCFSDRLALGLSQIAKARGMQLPRDLSMIGYDDQKGVADAMLPGLTTVRLPFREMGLFAIEGVGQSSRDLRGRVVSVPV
jgi:LacI family transcriptional regulator